VLFRSSTFKFVIFSTIFSIATMVSAKSFLINNYEINNISITTTNNSNKTNPKKSSNINNNKTRKNVKINSQKVHLNEQASILKRNSVANRNDMDNRNGSLPDIISSKADKDKSSNKARKFLEGLEGVKISEISVPDQLRKQLELFDREELLQLISYQKKFLDEKESRIKDLDQYIDNIVVKVIEYNPALLMQVASSLNRK